MTVRFPHLAVLLVLASRALAAPCGNPRDPADLGIDLSRQTDCDPLVPEQCMLPFPNDYFTVPDIRTRTHRRVNFTPEGLPKNTSGTPLDATELNRSDGFSPGAALLMWMPTVDLVRSGAPPLTDIERSLAPDSPIVIVDARTGKRWPLWAELDMNSPPANRALIVRPATNFLEGHRYVVGVRRLVDADGVALPPSPAFAAYRDGTCTTDPTFESRREHMESLFDVLRGRRGRAATSCSSRGTSRWRASRTLAGRLLHIRDDAFRSLGTTRPGVHRHLDRGEPGAGVPAANPRHLRGAALPHGRRQPRAALRPRRGRASRSARRAPSRRPSPATCRRVPSAALRG